MHRMPFGEYHNNLNISLSDSAELQAVAYDQDNIPVIAGDLSSVEFTTQRPDGTRDVESGEILDDGAGFLRYENTDELGTYVAVAQFTLVSGEKRSYRLNFRVNDPFAETPITSEHLIADAVWLRLEDCFDSTEGGPWLREVTLSYFNKEKILPLIDDALLDISLAPRAATVMLADFTTPVNGGQANPDMGVLTQATLVATIRHLMRSYVEQPTPTGAQVVYEDRRDYLQRWQSILQIEQERMTRLTALWKRQFLGLGKTSSLISNKAGRLVQAPMRTRTAGRGYY